MTREEKQTIVPSGQAVEDAALHNIVQQSLLAPPKPALEETTMIRSLP